MRNTMQVIHISQSYPLSHGLAMLRYVGFKYPESQWAGLVDEVPQYETSVIETGYITLQAEGADVMYEMERKLLSMARSYGAHIVLIDSINTYEIKNTSIHKQNSGVQVYGRCQRFDL